MTDDSQGNSARCMDLANVICVMIDMDQRITYLNAGGRDILRLGSEEIIGKKWFDTFVPQGVREEARKGHLSLLERKPGESEYCESQVLTADGQELTIAWCITVIADEQGNPVGVLCSGNDVTKYRQTEEALRNREERYRQLFNGINDAVLVHGFDENGMPSKFTEVNDVACRYLGYTREELLQMGPHEIDAPEGWALVPAIAEKVRAEKHAVWEGVHVTKAGKKIPVEISNHLFEMNGEPIVIVTVRDITERKEAEESVQESELRYRAIYEQAPLGIALIETKTGRFLEVNQKYCEIVGRTHEEMMQIGFQTVTHPDDLQADIENLEELVKGNRRILNNQKRYLRPDGTTVWANLTVVPMWSEGETPNFQIAMIEDITKRRQAEEALRESEQRYRAIYEQAPLGVALVDFTTGRFLEVNPKYCEIVQRDHEEMLKLRFQDITHPDDLDEDLQNAARQFEGEIRIVNRQKRYIRPDDTVVWANLTVVPMWSVGECATCQIVMIEDITDKKKAEDALRLDELRLEALLKLSQMTRSSLTEISNFALEEAVRLTGSKIGYLAFANETEDLFRMYAWSRQAMEECIMQDKPIDYTLDHMGLWGEAIRQRKPIITNDYAAPNAWKRGYPEGHIRISRHMNVPVFDGDRIVALAGVGNKEEEYNESDLRQLTLLMDGMWRITERIKAEEQKRDFYRRTILAATEGKLIITDLEEIEEIAGPSLASWEIRQGRDLGSIRKHVAEIAESAEMGQGRIDDFVLCVGESTTNAYKHASEGEASLHREDGKFIFVVTDNGPGIETLALPEVALKKGYTTATSLGMGYKAMITLADHVYLATGPRGTTVAVEMRLKEEQMPSILADLPDTW